MREYLSLREGGVAGSSPTDPLAPIVTTYLTTALMPSMGEALGLRNGRELLTLARAVDALLRGDTVVAAECLLQRFKAVEMSAIEGSWSNAKHLEVIPEQRVTAISGAERRHAHACERTESRNRVGTAAGSSHGMEMRSKAGKGDGKSDLKQSG
eukprot:4770000-Amphidinium_carterae.1